VASFQTPCRSGSPHGVCGTAVFVAAPVVLGAVFRVWPAAGVATAIMAARNTSKSKIDSSGAPFHPFYFAACLPKCPYSSSSVNGRHLNFTSWTLFSAQR